MDNSPTTICPICGMASSCDMFGGSNLTRLLAKSYIFCWSEGIFKFQGCNLQGWRRQQSHNIVVDDLFQAEL